MQGAAIDADGFGEASQGVSDARFTRARIIRFPLAEWEFSFPSQPFCVFDQMRFASVSGLAAYSRAVSRVIRRSRTRRCSSMSMDIMFLSVPP